MRAELEEPARAEVLAEVCAIAEAVDALAERASYCAKLARIVTGELRLRMAIVTALALRRERADVHLHALVANTRPP